VTTQNQPVPARPAPPLVQQCILLTGASGGIGRATAARLAAAGHLVFADTRRAEELQALAATHPGIRPVVLDITDQAAIDHARHQITDQTSGHGLDVLINAAGTLILGLVEAVSDPRPGPVRGQPVRHPGRHPGLPPPHARPRTGSHRQRRQHHGPLRAAGQRDRHCCTCRE